MPAEPGEKNADEKGDTLMSKLCAVLKNTLRGVWGGVMSDRLWHLLRADEIPDSVSARKSICHRHVLPPDSRHLVKA